MIAILCPYCETEVDISAEDTDTQICKACGREFSVEAQFAYERGQAHYDAAMDIERAARWRVREDSPTMTDMLRNYEHAYSSLRVALQHTLPHSYHADALTMLAEIMRRFLKREMVSSMESSYWTQRITQLTVTEEYAELQRKLEAREGNFLQRWHWRLRSGQLGRTIPELEEKIAVMEREIAFTE
ncbi:MAG: hypothetical protein JXA33_18675 [Anaerolineae bacterium]|nr:hypothetical protein [Anaerolineae bacterium]